MPKIPMSEYNQCESCLHYVEIYDANKDTSQVLSKFCDVHIGHLGLINLNQMLHGSTVITAFQNNAACGNTERRFYTCGHINSKGKNYCCDCGAKLKDAENE